MDFFFMPTPENFNTYLKMNLYLIILAFLYHFRDLVKIYLNYKLELQNPEEAETAEEKLINVLSEYCSSYCPKSTVGWILLNCLYKKYNYKAGMSYTRWKYENLYDNIFVQLELIPISRWEIYLPYKITSKSVKDQNFIKVMYQLLTLGLYDFAEWVFNEISNECLEVEKYLILNTFKIFKNDLDPKFSAKNFPVEKMLNPLHLVILTFIISKVFYDI